MADHQSPYCHQCGGETVQAEVEGRSRPKCVDCGSITYYDPKLAVAVIISRDGEILLGKRGPGTREAGKWSFPAGFVERGERVEVAAAREAREEVNLAVEVGEILLIVSYEGEAVVLAVYLVASFSGVAAAGDDLIDVGWFSPDRLPDLAFPHDQAIIDAWVSAAGSERQA
ncbi:hypothetical protein BH23CHL5_BH23CHL5_11000 [soil metagenome]